MTGGGEARRRSREEVEREYGRDKWPAIERMIEQERAGEGPDAALSRVLGRVARRERFPGSSLDPHPTVAAAQAVELPRSAAFGAYQALIVDAVLDACGPATTLVLELGAGWGRNVLSVWLAGGPPAFYVAAEYTEAGQRAAAALAELEPRLRFRAIPFDYHAPRLAGLGSHEHAVVFSAHSVEQIPRLSADVFDAVRNVAERVDCLHFEPVGWQLGSAAGTSREYAELHDYNRDLVEMLRGEEAAGRIEIRSMVADVVGVNPRNSTSVLTWRSGPRGPSGS